MQVDAALDLSHTQNIGRMIKQHFPQSQFIVVSLKEGMFSNANILFRTKFVDGCSTVTRIVNKLVAPPALAAGAAGGSRLALGDVSNQQQGAGGSKKASAGAGGRKRALDAARAEADAVAEEDA